MRDKTTILIVFIIISGTGCIQERSNEEIAKSYYFKALEYDDAGDYPKAIEYYEKSIGYYPNNYNTYYNKALCLYKVNRLQEALETINKGLEIENRDYEGLSLRGEIYFNLGEYNKSKRDLNRSLALNQEDSSLWVDYCAVLDKLKRYDEALLACDKALGLDSNNSLAWSNRGGVLKGLSRYNESLSSFEKALEINPRDIMPMKGIVEVKGELRKDTEIIWIKHEIQEHKISFDKPDYWMTVEDPDAEKLEIILMGEHSILRFKIDEVDPEYTLEDFLGNIDVYDSKKIEINGKEAYTAKTRAKDTPTEYSVTIIKCNATKMLTITQLTENKETKNYQQIMSRIVNSARC